MVSSEIGLIHTMLTFSSYLVDLENAFVGEESAESCFLPKEALREFELIEWHWIDGSLWHCGKGDNEYPGIDVA